MKVCKSCGEINTNDCEYCCNCGKTAFVFQEEIKCQSCGAVNDTSFSYCINCGSVLRPSVNVEDVAPTVAPVVRPNEDDGYTPVPVDLKEQLSEVYGGLSSSTPTETASCPNCGAIVPIFAIYCQKCGASVANLHDHRVVKRKICPHCGRPNSLEAHFCAYCFCSLAEAETQEMQVVHDTHHIGSEVMKQAFLQDEHGKKKICENCGSLNPLDELFCVNCGLKLDAEEQKRYCPNCGAENSIESAFCTRCQWSFEGSAPNAVSKWVCEKCHAINDQNDAFCTVCGARKDKQGRK